MMMGWMPVMVIVLSGWFHFIEYHKRYSQIGKKIPLFGLSNGHYFPIYKWKGKRSFTRRCFKIIL